MKEKLEFVCECGRSYILYGDPAQKTKKCLRCGRMMQAAGSASPQKEAVQEVRRPVPQKMRDIEETWEHERFETYIEEPYTFWRRLKKIFTLFSFKKSSRRY